MDVSREQAHGLIERWFQAAVSAVEPETAVARHLRRSGDRLVFDGTAIDVSRRLIVVAVGKAAMAMARAAAAVAGELIDAGIILTKEGHANSTPPPTFEVFEAAHPIPDERGARATRQILELVSDLESGDVVLALISGGGSALLEAPRHPVTLTDLALTTDALLRAGAPIEDLNAVRRPLSLVKAGGLLRAAAPASVVTVVLSDVLGNDPTIIASGPTVPGRPNVATALTVLNRYGVREAMPASVLCALDALRSEQVVAEPPPGHIAIVADNDAAVGAAAAAADADGFRVEVVLREATGEASQLGQAWVDRCRDADKSTDVLLGGGEATVTVLGDGIGGRNTEFALAAALALAETDTRNWVVASLATDGEDGPTGVAGAIADPETAQRVVAAGLSPDALLANNDSLHAFEVAGGIVRSGPTGTNVNDLYFAVRISPE